MTPLEGTTARGATGGPARVRVLWRGALTRGCMSKVGCILESGVNQGVRRAQTKRRSPARRSPTSPRDASRPPADAKGTPSKVEDLARAPHLATSRPHPSKLHRTHEGGGGGAPGAGACMGHRLMPHTGLRR